MKSQRKSFSVFLLCFALVLHLSQTIHLRYNPKILNQMQIHVNDLKLDVSNNNTYSQRYFKQGGFDYKIDFDFQNRSRNTTIFRPMKLDYKPYLEQTSRDYIESQFNQKLLDKVFPEQKVQLDYLKSYSDLSECNFNKRLILEKHNLLRFKHNAQPLKWSVTLQSQAQSFTQKLQFLNCPFKFEKTIGELYAYEIDKIYTEEELVDHWYEGAYNWNFKFQTPSKNQYNVRDFKQVLWNSTQEIGCSKACCADKQIWICKYYPPANNNLINKIDLDKELLPPNQIFKDTFTNQS